MTVNAKRFCTARLLTAAAHLAQQTGSRLGFTDSQIVMLHSKPFNRVVVKGSTGAHVMMLQRKALQPFGCQGQH